MEEKLREILEERRNFVRTECLVDSLLRIDEEDVEYCKGCYYFGWSNEEDVIKGCEVVYSSLFNEAR